MALMYLVPVAILGPIILVLLKTYFGISLFTRTLLTILILLIAIVFVAKKISTKEKQLRYQEKLTKLLVENRRDYAIFMLDPEGKVMTWNAGAERLTGFTTADVIGTDFSIFFTPEDKNKDQPNALLALAKNKKQAEYEGWRVHKNGNPFWATITIAAIYDENNQLTGYSKLIRNSTRQKIADDKLKHLVTNLEKSNKELERFAYIASHDLQEPLRMVASYTQLLEKKYQDKLDQDAKDYIHFAVDGALRMQQLITDLLAYSRVTTRAKPFTPTNCKTIVDHAIQNLRVAIDETKAEITQDPLPTILADETQILQLFQNLISNAIKFHRNAPPKIHISVQQRENEWFFTVNDNGIGIAPEYHEQIFQIFQRLHHRNEIPGTGVGLAVCKKIVERHGGKIWVVSDLGKGATFCFTIPV